MKFVPLSLLLRTFPNVPGLNALETERVPERPLAIANPRLTATPSSPLVNTHLAAWMSAGKATARPSTSLEQFQPAPVQNTPGMNLKIFLPAASYVMYAVIISGVFKFMNDDRK